jgi:6-phosphogluconolactonase/glucosamine-6-phosphate isomerase/deaminase
MAEVLVAPLGNHPAIISATAQKLLQDGIAIERVYILCPNEPLIQQGADWLRLELEDTLTLATGQCDLLFADANSEQAALEYLQALAATLQTCEAMGDRVHLLLAGGRKNLSALTGVIAQFFPCVQHLYHLLDVYEDDPLLRNLFSVDELCAMDDAQRKSKMFPPADSLLLFEVPFPRINDVAAIRQYLYDPLSQETPTLSLSPEVENFYHDVFQPRRSEPLFDLQLSETAFAAFNDLWERDRNRVEVFRTCFKQMQQPERLKNGVHGTFNAQEATFHFYKRRRTVERPFFYTAPNPIAVYPKKEVSCVVVCGLSVEQGNGQYDPTADELLANAERTPKHSLSELPKAQQPVVLLASLGDSTMVASQAYALLQQQHQVVRTVLLSLEANQALNNQAVELKTLFEREGIVCDLKPIPDLEDVRSTADCEAYLQFVVQTIKDLQEQDQDDEINLLLSGGRKSMAVLNLFAAQRAGLTKVWHTLVNDSALEQQIENDLSNTTAKERREILFLRKYQTDQFTLFPVPIFPIA